MKEYILIAGLALFAAQSNADGLMLTANDVQEIRKAATSVLTEADVVGASKETEMVAPKEEANAATPKEGSEEKVMELKG